MEGTSFKPLLRDPVLEWKSAVFSQYHQRPKITPDGKRYMGYSMVTPRYHYVEWRHWDNDKKEAGELAAVELYDNRADPEENKNIAGLPENAAVIERLSKKLAAGWRAALPGK
jgi:iduronate 2-sulfatase